MKKGLSIAWFRGMKEWDRLEKKYYKDLSFMDIEYNFKLLNRKKTILKQDTAKVGSFSIGYFEKGLLLRIDDIQKTLPSETYLIWEKGRLKQVLTFRLGFFLGRRIIKEEGLYDMWEYEYNNKGKIIKMIATSFPDHTYYNHEGVTRVCRFEYDKKGLFRIYQRVGTNLSDLGGEILIYERGKKIK